MTNFINNYYFSLVFATMLVFFSLPLTHWYTENVLLYGIMTFVILLSTVVTEMTLNKTHDLKAKAKKMSWTFVPMNIIVFSVFIFFIF
ncbi:hypothetical protein [Staphylococcus intermedius]|uniref:Uncharacterized protein n=1 Tax=Staphylococcus intermedius NCTC 11048 TaxID=1141106 RepID=A0A380G6Y0_STAIN|nr:hypothetical protein [Staphylococcus intermedius]PCF77981.1 hypothetical protein B4W74_11770 [Staphylococcus intermedius]PCF85290.1 hypothetical protein B4W76_10260 [Staphylococcus intermedius]PCF86129.1 hypothetical protein B4W75_11435 [Staphylococcus intermedius]PNZ55364.1 hypothetical protein CD138_00420 [Staphylococcus intermedius NCTC 11048]SUM46090.1 Uncharacterised protein [Staphylococcus intermedius NCTC 11048]